MATLVKFFKETDSENAGILAYFPQLNWNNFSRLTKVAYAHIGQHTACSVEYANTLPMATDLNECKDLIVELTQAGYELKILNKFKK